MEIKWTRKAVSDVTRLYEFLAQVNKSAVTLHQETVPLRSRESGMMTLHRN
ncbi:hypothetical protein LMG19083_05003 [Ralstonia psammae]|uniref:Type II toxin-antitoxin system RelE/ParE family toxin n=1 Tax=Ralstonia psammae TaxID=3058598 RepID=A0ABM9K172_9RALS|nr:hypothetical protein LMG19083_05003 [Ralstonia sp. LMG 19083]